MADSSQPSRLVVGLTGPVGSGVSTVGEALSIHGNFIRIRLSGQVKDELRKREQLTELLEVSEKTVRDCRKKLQEIGNELRQPNPARLVTDIIDKIPKDRDVVIEGIRNTAEAVALRDAIPRFFLLTINADFETRWRRVQEQYDKNLKAFERDDRRDADEEQEWGQQVTRCVQMADYVFINDVDAGSSSVRLQKVYQQLNTDLMLMRAVDKSSKATGYIRPPTADEVHMATAYSQSHTSQC